LYFFDELRDGTSYNLLYIGQYAVGYPIVWLNSWTGISIDTIFLWFNFLVLLFIGYAVFYVIGSIMDWWTGIVALLLVMFCIPSTFVMFNNGTIYDLATVGVLYPLLLLFVVKSVATRRWFWLSLAVIFTIICVGFHSVSVFYRSQDLVYETVPPFASLFLAFMGVLTTVFLVFCIISLVFNRHKIILERRQLTLVVLVVGTVIALGITAFTGVTYFSTRVALDLSMVMAMLSAVLFGIMVKYEKEKYVAGILVFVVVIGSVFGIGNYCNYNSAISKTDIQAINYVNELNGDYYSCSPEVAPWIYGRYLNKEYKEGELPFISRNTPMTFRTDPTGLYYWWSDNATVPSYDLTSAAKFNSSDVTIYVVESEK
jgi:hypothetical protein